MKKILAVSGGIDSVVMLDMYRDDLEVVVAHFNHGTRKSADEDCRFIREMAEKYRKPFIFREGKLGEEVSEAVAREARYEFLRSLKESENDVIFTAHHLDDLCESVAINFIRGTGWRGLTPFFATDIKRPLLERKMGKREIYRYAAERQLTFREDPTNNEGKFLRNRLRRKVRGLPEENKEKIWMLWREQGEKRREIEQILEELQPKTGIYQRAWFLGLEDKVALEFLKVALRSRGMSATRPKLEEFLLAIRTYAPHKAFNLPGGRLVRFSKTTFVFDEV